MENITNIQEELKKSERLLFLSNLFQSKKLILSTLEQLAKTNKLISVSILKYSYIKENIKISNDPKLNKEILQNEISKKWKIEKEINELNKLMELENVHKESDMEFKRKNKIIILDKEQNIYSVDITKLKKYMYLIKRIKGILNEKLQK